MNLWLAYLSTRVLQLYIFYSKSTIVNYYILQHSDVILLQFKIYFDLYIFLTEFYFDKVFILFFVITLQLL